MRIRVKICGITSLPDALGAIEAGVDALGFMFWEPSKRHITIEQAARITTQLPPFVSKVGVFVNAPAEAVREAVSRCGLDTVQLHGEEPAEFCRQFKPGVKVIKAFRIKDATSLRQLHHYDTDAWLLDSFVTGWQGGTGRSFDWSVAREARDAGCPIILAGGLRPDNVAEAIHEVWPFGVDVSSGVENAPGVKDAAKIKHFVEAVRSVEQQRQ
jgi:phosphoribosylanthranilate isomerase